MAFCTTLAYLLSLISTTYACTASVSQLEGLSLELLFYCPLCKGGCDRADHASLSGRAMIAMGSKSEVTQLAINGLLFCAFPWTVRSASSEIPLLFVSTWATVAFVPVCSASQNYQAECFSTLTPITSISTARTVSSFSLASAFRYIAWPGRPTFGREDQGL